MWFIVFIVFFFLFRFSKVFIYFRSGVEFNGSVSINGLYRYYYATFKLIRQGDKLDYRFFFINANFTRTDAWVFVNPAVSFDLFIVAEY